MHDPWRGRDTARGGVSSLQVNDDELGANGLHNVIRSSVRPLKMPCCCLDDGRIRQQHQGFQTCVAETTGTDSGNCRFTDRAAAKGWPMTNLLYIAVVFLIIAVVAAFLGFGGVAGTAMEGARMLFWVAIVLFIISLVVGLIRRGS